MDKETEAFVKIVSDYFKGRGPFKPAKQEGMVRSSANDALTLSAAHRLLGTLKDETNSRAIHDECEDVMAKLSKIVEG